MVTGFVRVRVKVALPTVVVTASTVWVPKMPPTFCVS